MMRDSIYGMMPGNKKIDLINDDQNSRFSQPDDSIRTT